ncbi:transporter, major facilitator family protein [Caballeronia pedi]|uniref:Transporter, major facilitator family protein n=1 Tax=Caballeronia pedi TaxID=1777141 RepID=A0A157ZSB9_9BURK|nr:MFS transporter [Caballeronia pedi]SAK48401.1 transporter, major facilitator family protein [Caballeronia pedi]
MDLKEAIPRTPDTFDISRTQATAVRPYKKIDARIIPFLFLCYMLAYLDRINIGFANLQMQSDVGITDKVFGFAAGMFFLGYVLFELPSNLLLVKVGARKTISRILVLWGLASASMLFVDSATKFYVLRFLLGVFEAGFAPGMLYYLTLWYPTSRMATVSSTVMLSAPIAAIVGGPLSGYIMSTMNGVHGLGGWQWMFLLEGLPAALVGVVAFFYLSDTPEKASWLNDDEKQVVSSLTQRSGATHGSLRNVLTNRHFYLLSGVLFSVISGAYVVSFWLPSIVKTSGVTSLTEIGMYSAIPYIPAAFAMILGGMWSDRKGERKGFVACLMVGVALAMLVAAYTPQYFAVSFSALCVAAALSWTAITTFWAIPSAHYSVALLGGFVAPSLIGVMKTLTGNFQSGMLVVAVIEVVGAGLLLLSRRA